MKRGNWLMILLVLAVLLAGCGKAESPEEHIQTAQTDAVVSVEETTEETTMPTVAESVELSNIWDIMDNEGVEEIALLKGLEVVDINAWQKNSPFQEIKLYQRTLHETIRLGTVGDAVVAQFVTNPDVYQTDYDYSADPVWNVRMEKSDGLKNNTGIEIPEDAWYSEYTINRPKKKTVQVVCYDWPIEGDPEDTTAPVRTVELFLVYFEDTQNLYAIYSNEAVFTWNGASWDSNIHRTPDVVLSYIEADGSDYYKHITDYDLKYNRGDVHYFRIKVPNDMRTYQFEVGMTLEQWVYSKYNTDGWKKEQTGHGYSVCSPDGSYKYDPEKYVWGVMYPG